MDLSQFVYKTTIQRTSRLVDNKKAILYWSYKVAFYWVKQNQINCGVYAPHILVFVNEKIFAFQKLSGTILARQTGLKRKIQKKFFSF